MVVGTLSSSIYSLNVSKAAAKDAFAAKLVTAGHNKGELWGVATHPTKDEYATVGDDGKLRVWDIKTRSLRTKSAALDLKSMSRCVAYSPDGTKIAVGLGGGNKKDKAEVRVCEERSYDLKRRAYGTSMSNANTFLTSQTSAPSLVVGLLPRLQRG